MSLSIYQKQNYLYFGMIILTILLAIVSYQFLEKKWLLYRQAEKKFEEKQYLEAIKLYKESLAEGMTKPVALSRIGDSYAAMQDFPEAIKWYRFYLKQYPKDTNIRFSLARLLSWSGHLKEAEEEYKQVLEENNQLEEQHKNEEDQIP